MSACEDSWVVVDKTTGGSLRTKASHESLYLSDDSDGAKARVHIRGGQPGGDGSVAPELLEWINNAANESTNSLEANRKPSTSKASFRTNSSSAGNRQRRTQRRSSVHATAEVSAHALEPDAYNEGMFVVKVLEVRQVGATRPMNLQCTAQVGDERFVIPAVATKPSAPQVWASKLNDTFVFDVARQFTFQLGVFGTQPHVPRARAGSVLAGRMMPRRHPAVRHSVAIGNESSSSLASNGSTRTTAKIRRGLRKIFRNKNGGLEAIASDPAYAGCAAAEPALAAVAEDALVLEHDAVLSEHATDVLGRQFEIQKHSAAQADADAELAAAGLPADLEARSRGASFAEFAQHPAISRLSSYLPRNRTSTTTSAHEINYNGPRLRAFSNASSVSATPQPLGELFLDLRVDRREKRRATFTLPVVNQDQVAMRGGAHVEMQVELEYGIIVHETYTERAQRLKREQESAQRDLVHQRQQRMEQQWAAIDTQDRLPRLRGYLSVFTRSGRVSTWKRYWAVLSCTRILFYDSEADEVQERAPAAKVSLFHLHDAGLPESDLVSIGPTGLELRLSPLAMTDRHRRKSAFPRASAVDSLDRARQLQREAQRVPLPTAAMAHMSLSPEKKRVDDMSLLLADEDDATLFKFSEWQCRVYVLLDTLRDRDTWLRELKQNAVPSCEFARFRQRQRKAWREHEFASATQSLRESGRQLDVVSAKARDGLSEARNASAKKVFVECIRHKAGGKEADKMLVECIPHKSGQLLPPPPHRDEEEELEGATLTSLAPHDKKPAVAGNARKPVAMAFGKPATFDIVVAPSPAKTPVVVPPAKKRMRAHRRSSSVGDLRSTLRKPDSTLVPPSSDEDDNVSDKSDARSSRRDSGASTVIEVVGEAKERRAGTVSRRFLFVWNVNDI